GIAPTLVVARVAAGQAGPKQIWPWDNDSGVHSSQGPLISLPQFSTHERSAAQTHVNPSTVTRTFYDHEVSVDSDNPEIPKNNFYKSNEVV
ncbi:hypothetical protein C0991_007405, partial [Blastosporella zonata]